MLTEVTASMRHSLRLSRPVYELLPFVYMTIGLLAIGIAYLDPQGPGTTIALSIAMICEIGALTILLRRRDYRELQREYSAHRVELPSTVSG